MHYVSHYESPLGAMTMASDGEHLTGLWFDGQKYDRSTIDGNAELKPHLPVFTQTAQWLDAYFEGTDPGFTPPISVKGSDFKKMVSSIMLSIPFGATSTYARIAAEVARCTGRKQMSAQAVGWRGRAQSNRSHRAVPPRARLRREPARLRGRG